MNELCWSLWNDCISFLKISILTDDVNLQMIQDLYNLSCIFKKRDFILFFSSFNLIVSISVKLNKIRIIQK